MNRVWFDVGAHIGSHSAPFAYADPTLHVHAFEPHPRVAKRLAASVSVLPNYTVWPVAVGVKDGFSDFYLSSDDGDGCSSLLPFDSEGVKQWSEIVPASLKTVEVVTVPVIRLDSFMDLAGIQKVDYLKVDAQGSDLAVVRSAGARLRDIARITLEVQISTVPLYSGGSEKCATVEFLLQSGFRLESCVRQTFDLEENLTFCQI